MGKCSVENSGICFPTSENMIVRILRKLLSFLSFLNFESHVQTWTQAWFLISKSQTTLSNICKILPSYRFIFHMEFLKGDLQLQASFMPAWLISRTSLSKSSVCWKIYDFFDCIRILIHWRCEIVLQACQKPPSPQYYMSVILALFSTLNFSISSFERIDTWQLKHCRLHTWLRINDCPRIRKTFTLSFASKFERFFLQNYLLVSFIKVSNKFFLFLVNYLTDNFLIL